MFILCSTLCSILKSDMKKPPNFGGFSAGDERIELPLRVLETPVIPFDQSPSLVFLTVFTYITFWTVMSSILYSMNRENHYQTAEAVHMTKRL